MALVDRSTRIPFAPRTEAEQCANSRDKKRWS